MPRKRAFSNLFWVVAILLWIAVGLAAYYAFHRPFSPDFAFRIAVAVAEIFVVALLLAVAGGVGTSLLPELVTPKLARFGARAALGFGTLSFGYLLIGSTLGTNSFLAWAILLGLAIIFRRDISDWWADISEFKALWKGSRAFERTITWMASAIILIELFKALAPVTSFDSLVYHLTLPKIYVAQGYIGFVANNTFSGYPQLAEVLITWSRALGMQSGALLGWVMGLLAVIGIFGHLGARLRSRAAWVGIAALLCGTSLAGALSSAYVDWPTILMGWSAIFCVDLWMEKRNPQLAAWAGVFAGLAFGTKYTAGVLAPLCLLVILWLGRFDWRAVFRFAVAAFVVASPWVIRNFLSTGNPFYPLLVAVGEMDAFRLSYYQGFAPQGSWLDALLLPLRATWAGIEGARISNAPGYESSIGPLLLILGLLGMLPNNLDKKSRNLKESAIILGVGGLAAWAIAGSLSGHLIRTQLYYVLFPAFAILAAFGFVAVQNFDLPKLRISRVLEAVVVLALGLNLTQIGIDSINSGLLSFWSGGLSTQAYEEKNLGVYANATSSLSETGERVLFLWEPRSYACATDCDPDEIIDRWPHDLALYRSPAAVIDAWRAAGFSEVLYYRLGAKFIYDDPQHFHPYDFDSMDAALSSLPVIQDYNGVYILLSLSQ